MSKTLKLTVSFPMTIVVKTDTITQLRESREEARKIPAEEVAKLRGETKFRFELFTGDKSDEEVLETIYRQGLRSGVRELIMGEIQGNESTCRLGDIKVTFQAPPKRSCQGCIETNCVKAERNTNAGCDGKRTGVREPGPRWTETL